MSALVYASTFSKSPKAWGFDPDTHVIYGSGQYLKLSDGRKYVDWVSGLGTNLLGYCAFDRTEFADLCSPSLPHRLEHEAADHLAALLAAYVPGWAGVPLGVRWCKTGSEATTMAVRLARAVTGREDLISFDGHYHGWLDWTISRTSPAWGIPKGTAGWIHGGKFGDMSSIGWLGSDETDIAAILFEHPAWDEKPEWYDQMRNRASDCGALLIADEVVTSLRYGLGGACGRYGIRPDLVCVGKALGNGAPIAALVGPREYMDWFARSDPVFCSSTTWGETGGLQAADYVLRHWGQDKVDYLWTIGGALMAGLRAAGWDVFGHGARSVLRFETDEERAFFVHGMRERGFLMNRPNFPCMAHTPEDVEATCNAAAEVRAEFERLELGQVAERVAGKLPRVLFRSR